jgi:hypothetical protein
VGPPLFEVSLLSRFPVCFQRITGEVHAARNSPFLAFVSAAESSSRERLAVLVELKVVLIILHFDFFFCFALSGAQEKICYR